MFPVLVFHVSVPTFLLRFLNNHFMLLFTPGMVCDLDRVHAIRYSVKKAGRYGLHLFEDLLMKAYEENDYYSRILEGKHVDFVPERSGKIAILTNAGEKSQEVFELYKFHNDFEESFDVFKNLLMPD